jgi:hypothetical protein
VKLQRNRARNPATDFKTKIQGWVEFAKGQNREKMNFTMPLAADPNKLVYNVQASRALNKVNVN